MQQSTVEAIQDQRPRRGSDDADDDEIISPYKAIVQLDQQKLRSQDFELPLAPGMQWWRRCAKGRGR